MEVTPSDFGTPESKRHGVFKLDPRDTRNGMVITTGHTNLASDLLEALYYYGHLKGTFEKSHHEHDRVVNGRGFQEIHCAFRTKGKDPAATGAVYTMMPTLDGHVGGDRDIWETVYQTVMRRLGIHASVVENVCISGVLCTNPKRIRKALDAIPRAIYGAEEEIRRNAARETKRERV